MSLASIRFCAENADGLAAVARNTSTIPFWFGKFGRPVSVKRGVSGIAGTPVPNARVTIKSCRVFALHSNQMWRASVVAVAVTPTGSIGGEYVITPELHRHNLREVGESNTHPALSPDVGNPSAWLLIVDPAPIAKNCCTLVAADRVIFLYKTQRRLK